MATDDHAAPAPEAGFLPVGVDVERANAARMYDFLLGGAHHFAVDREQAAKVLAAYPDAREAARTNRAYLRRVVLWALERGVDQFLDLGSGVPTAGNVHEVAQRVEPRARVAYVDVEPVAVAHAREILATSSGVTVTHADLRAPADVLEAPGVAGLLDFTRPVALLACCVLHFVPGDVAPVLAAYRERLAAGSVVALSHSSDDVDDPALAARMRSMIEAYRGSATEGTLRSRDGLRALLAGLDVADPGVVDISRWPVPQDGAAETGVLAAVARVP